MRAIVISDIHGNIDVLRALESRWGSRLEAFDRVVCLGDLVDYGPDPGEVIDWIRAHATDVVRGNHDHAMATGEPCRSSPAYLEASIETRRRLASTLTRDQIAYLEGLPVTRALVAGDRIWQLVHATPADPLYGYLSPESTDDRWVAAMAGVAGQMVLAGHIHLPLVRLVEGGLVINPGSIGMPKDGHPSGSYAIIEDGAVRFFRVVYNPEPMIGRLRSLDLPGLILDQLAQVFRTGT
jgi:predicted phosphodiesterase